MRKFTTLDITAGAMFVGLMAIGANITAWFPFLVIPIGGASIPLSLQTFFACLAGLMLGRRLGSFSMLAYLLVGMAGVPIFAQMNGGPFVFFSYTGGFLLSYIFVAYIAGWLVERQREQKMLSYLTAAMAGVAVNYLIGVNYMYVSMNTWLGLEINYGIAWAGMIPFLIKDVAITFVAASLMIKIAGRVKSFIPVKSSSVNR